MNVAIKLALIIAGLCAIGCYASDLSVYEDSKEKRLWKKAQKCARETNPFQVGLEDELEKEDRIALITFAMLYLSPTNPTGDEMYRSLLSKHKKKPKTIEHLKSIKRYKKALGIWYKHKKKLDLEKKMYGY